jgi:hypothetical protein
VVYTNYRGQFTVTGDFAGRDVTITASQRRFDFGFPRNYTLDGNNLVLQDFVAIPN